MKPEDSLEENGWAGTFARAGRRLLKNLLPGVRPDAERALALIETLTLGPKKQVHLLVCDGERFLVGTGTEGVATIVPVHRVARAIESSDAGLRASAASVARWS